jgi:hypothetical protein
MKKHTLTIVLFATVLLVFVVSAAKTQAVDPIPGDLNYNGIADELEPKNDIVTDSVPAPDMRLFQDAFSSLSSGSPVGYRSVYFANMVENNFAGAYNDLFLYNAILWASFKPIGEPIQAVVLDSWGSQYGVDVWNYLAGNHPDIAISFRDGEIVTPGMLASTNANVLIISDAWNRDWGWEFSDDEIQAIEDYISQGRGLIGTAGSMDSDAPNNAKLGPLFGNGETVQPWGYTIIDPDKYPLQRDAQYLHIDDPYHPMTVGLPSGYDCYTTVCVWMSPVDSNQVAHFDVYTDSLVTAYQSAIEVTIDIKPGSDPNCFNNNGHGVIPVAILGSTDFDVTQIDASTIQLEGLVVKAVGKSSKLLAHIEDVNKDGFGDLVVQIEDIGGVFSPGDTTATVTGKLYDGTLFVGTDSIRIVGSSAPAPRLSTQSRLTTTWASVKSKH